MRRCVLPTTTLKALEDQLHCKLQLPRRTGVTDREARGGNHAKSLVPHLGGTVGLTEVGMVQQIEGFHAEFMAETFRDFRPLDDGEIDAVESRSNNRVPSHL